MDKIKCNKCGAENDANAKFCSNCSAPLTLEGITKANNKKIVAIVVPVVVALVIIIAVLVMLLLKSNSPEPETTEITEGPHIVTEVEEVTEKTIADITSVDYKGYDVIDEYGDGFFGATFTLSVDGKADDIEYTFYYDLYDDDYVNYTREFYSTIYMPASDTKLWFGSQQGISYVEARPVIYDEHGYIVSKGEPTVVFDLENINSFPEVSPNNWNNMVSDFVEINP